MKNRLYKIYGGNDIDWWIRQSSGNYYLRGKISRFSKSLNRKSCLKLELKQF